MISLGNEYPFSTVYKAKLIIKSTNKLIQDISDTSNQCIVADYEFLDVNFDGYLDIRFVDNIDMAANTSYHYWIFDKQMKKYVFNKSFSEVLINELNIDSINHTIQSTCRIGCAGRCESVYVYRVESEKLILVEQSIDSEEYVNDELQIITKHYKLVNGEMIENN